MRILVIEDERRMAELLRQGLTEEGHSVTVVLDGAEGFNVAKSFPFDLILLDLMLPGMDGLSIARRLRAGQNRTPILMLTARDQTAEVIHGLDAGADDYMTKPFSFDELLARVRAVARRGPIPRAIWINAGSLSLNQASHEVKRGGRTISLTRKEYALLELLIRHPGQVIARERIIEGVWGVGADVESNTLDAFIRLLRSKIDIPGESQLIRTVRGIGYRLDSEQA
jgi:DNA-binding response OmpR family regulator